MLTREICIDPFSQLTVTTGTKKLVAATAFRAGSVLFLARHFQKEHRKKAHSCQLKQAGFNVPLRSTENGKR